jgi:hypothetical protein
MQIKTKKDSNITFGFQGNKSKNAFALILMLILACSIMLSMPIAQAQTVDRQTYPFIVAVPNPVGLNQVAAVSMWLSEFPPSTANLAIPITPWTFVLTITNPDGTTQTNTYKSDAIGGTEVDFKPTKTGTYYFQFTFQQVTAAGVNFLSSTSEKLALTVQDQPVQSYPAASLPTGYWNRPINANNREWSTIAGNWLGMPDVGAPANQNNYDRWGNFNPYTTAPNTAHIVWTKPIAFGGIAGGSFGSANYYSGNGYEIKGNPDIIMNGRLYYNLPISDQPFGGGFACVDIRTGETLWTANGRISFGQLLNYKSLNQMGVLPYLWNMNGLGLAGQATSVSFEMYDAFSGQLVLTIVNAVTGSPFFGPSSAFVNDANGNLIEYYLDPYGGYLSMWNATKCILGQVPPETPAGFGYGDPNYWRPVPGAHYQYSVGLEWNVSISSAAIAAGIHIARMDDNVILCHSRVPGSGTAQPYVVEAGYSANDGHQIWLQTRTGDEALNGQSAYFSYVVGGDSGVYACFKQEAMTWYGYDINTGNKIWQTQPYTVNGWGEYFTTIGDGPAYYAYGNLYATSYDGVVHCYDMKTGAFKWATPPVSSGTEGPYGNYPYFGTFVIADGKLFVGNGEHHPITPMIRGYSLHCFDAFSGQPVWDILGYFNNPEIADGYLVSVANQYDMQIYSFGKGQTATTVSASPGAVVAGSEVTVTGTIYDKSAGAPDGTPAVSKDSMTPFMEYLYMQQPMPASITGVQINLVAIDSSGVSTSIGTVTSDGTGFFATSWKVPDTAGVYKIVANFASDESYFGSSALTAVTVQTAASAAASNGFNMMDIYLALAVAVIVIVIVIALAAVFIRRTK